MPNVAVSDENVENFEPTYDIHKDHPMAAAIWLKAQVEKGYLPRKRMRPVVSSLNSILKLNVLEPEEKTVAGFTANLHEILFVRWRNKQKATSIGTPDTYKTRIMWLMDEYRARCESPATYNPNERFKKYNENAKKSLIKDAAKKDTAKKESVPHLSLVTDSTPPPAPVPEPELVHPTVTLHIAFGQKQATLQLPPDTTLDLNIATALCQGILHNTEYSMADLGQLFGRLAAQANDFDWTKSVPDQIFKRA